MKRILIFISLLCSIQVFCQNDSDSTSPKLNLYFTSLAQLQKFNGNVLIAQGNNVLLKKTYNMLSQPKGMFVSPDSKFIIASVSKVFIKYSILKLVDNGTIKLEDKIDKYLDHFPNGSKISIWQLMTHTSGLPRELTDYDKFDSLTLGQTIKLAEREKLQFEPGSDTLYSNIAFFLLDAIIDKAGPGGYPRFVEQSILLPLHLSTTDEFTRISPQGLFAYGFAKQGASVDSIDKKNINRFETGNYYSTVNDLFLFSQEMFSGSVLSTSLAKKMLNRDSIVVQAGGRPGYRAYFYKNLKTDVTFIFLSNYSDIPFTDIIRDIPDILDGKPVDMPHAIERTEIHPGENVLQKYVGKYTLKADAQQTVTIAIQNRALVIIDKSGETTPMKADSNTTFYDDPHSNDGIEFVYDPVNKVYDLVIISSGIRLLTERIK